MIEIILKGFFTASPERVGHPENQNQLLGVDVLEWYHPTVIIRRQKNHERLATRPIRS